MNRAVEDIDPAVMAALLDYDYPGNIRELENIIERGAAQGGYPTVADSPVTLVERTVQVVHKESGSFPTLVERGGLYSLCIRTQWPELHTCCKNSWY